MITMTEIAKLTGVSQPTVSRVLNGNQAVNPEVRERVVACAKEHGYQPNVMAQSLAGSRTHLIGVILTDISNAFFADLVKYIEQEAGESLVVVPAQAQSRRWKEQLHSLPIPAVVITRRAEGLDCVYVDHREAGAQVGRHLQEQGCESYVFFGTMADEKFEGFAEEIKKHIPNFQKYFKNITTKEPAAIEGELRQHLEKYPGRVGIFAYNDRRALQLLGILQKMEVEVPGRAALVGFDNTYMCEYLYPSLSSVSQPNEAMAVKAVKLLLHKIEQPEDLHVEDWPMRARLIPRSSSVLASGV